MTLSAELAARASDRMRHMARRMLRGFPQVRRWEDTDDVAQGAALRLHRALAQLGDVDGRHFACLCAVQVRRELLDLARKYGNPRGSWRHCDTAVLRAATGDIDRIATAVAPPPAGLAAWTRFHELVATLPDGEREVFELSWYLGSGQREIARLLECSSRTVRRSWETARRRLVDGLAGECPG